jgi:tetratricopeptide (TPR) repeat protein
MKISFIVNILILIISVSVQSVLAKDNNFFEEGKELYEEKKYNDARFKFEQDIVFNPKNENSYLYLAKIFNKEKKSKLEEDNLDTVILLNPKNEDAIFYLTQLSIKNSNFKKAEDLIIKFKIVCKKKCSKEKELTKKLNILLKQ